MADSPQPAAADSPHSHLKFKHAVLKEKRKNLDGHKNSGDHDIDNAKVRCDAQIAEIEALIKSK